MFSTVPSKAEVILLQWSELRPEFLELVQSVPAPIRSGCSFSKAKLHAAQTDRLPAPYLEYCSRPES